MTFLAKTGDPIIDRNFDNMNKTAKDLRSCPLLNGQLLEKVGLKANALTSITHQLGRTWKGFLIVDLDTALTEVPYSIRSSSDNKVIQLHAKEACTVSIWIF